MPFQPFAHDWDRAEWSSHEQWQWLAVEIAEIRRCAGVGDQGDRSNLGEIIYLRAR